MKEEKRRREKEKAEREKARLKKEQLRKKQQQQEQQQQQQQQQKAAQGTGGVDNRLRRETPFLATIRFKNDLPEVMISACATGVSVNHMYREVSQALSRVHLTDRYNSL